MRGPLCVRCAASSRGTSSLGSVLTLRDAQKFSSTGRKSNVTLRLIHGEGQPKPNPPNPELVALLKDVLSMAERGELQSLALVALQSDGTVASGYSFETGFKVFTMVGLLEQMKQFVLGHAETP